MINKRAKTAHHITGNVKSEPKFVFGDSTFDTAGNARGGEDTILPDEHRISISHHVDHTTYLVSCLSRSLFGPILNSAGSGSGLDNAWAEALSLFGILFLGLCRASASDRCAHFYGVQCTRSTHTLYFFAALMENQGSDGGEGGERAMDLS